METNPDPKDRCARCNHTYSFHGGDGGSCRVIGCNKGDNGWTCPGFITEDAALPSE